mgnify:CR=1 FL=1
MNSFAELKRRNLRITGDTYHYRAAIKAAGGKWDNGAGVWLMPDRDSQRRMQGLVNGTYSEGFATRPEREVQPPAPPVGGTHTVLAAKLSDLRLKMEAMGLALTMSTEDNALRMAHKIGEVLTKLSQEEVK